MQIGFIDEFMDWLNGSPKAMMREEKRAQDETARRVSVRFARGNVNSQNPNKIGLTREDINRKLETTRELARKHST